ncbi:MAG: ATP phosphoribosyltransferase regulatory subunit, partial [Flavobacteriaceae bacterium]
ALYDAVFSEMRLEGVTIKLNNRKILSGIVEIIGAPYHLVDFTIALDKLDKIGKAGVVEEMLKKGISEKSVAKAEPLFALTGSNEDQLTVLRNFLASSEIGLKGVEELEYIISNVIKLGLATAELAIDVTLARGLNYYTGAIFEVTAPKGVEMGSIGGGGRYDDLTGIFGLKNVSGVGISFGLDRIYLVLEELELFPEEISQSLQVLCTNFGEQEALMSLNLIRELRKAGITADLYPTKTKIQKQFKYANNRNVPWVISIGAQELANNSFVAKDMRKGEQKIYRLDEVATFIETL